MSYRGVVHSSGRGKKRDTGAGQQPMQGRVQYSCQRATLADLFESLKNIVCPSTPKTPAKWKILDHAKGFLLEKEAYLSKLLALKEVFLQDDGGPKSLEEVREQYRRVYTKCLYLFFYRQTLDLLLRSGVLAPDQMVLPVVSEAISDLWKSLPPEQRATVQQCPVTESSVTLSQGPAHSTPCSSLDSSQLTNLNTSGTSALEEDLLQDAYDVVQRDMDAITANSPTPSGDYEKLRETYKDITSFLRSHMSEEQELTQDMCLTADYEELFLRCSESFDEDF
ncbi:stimulated by retinoic acid gene 8 protein homolog isoform X2 [Salminus brasiliensis]|uniref:stimulated by retinoic acid gene 8 protein homolog isoform X2 n=1 Tax=Salminus brasiliensis TaxID=930266 RepID=UPI003B838CF5